MAIETNPGNFRVPLPTATSIGRFMPYMRGMMAGGALVGTVIYAATQVLPNGWRPGDVAGKTAGGTLSHEIRESIDAVVDRDRRVSDSHAQPAAKAQIDVALVTAVLQERTQSLLPNSNIAGVTDAVCMGAQIAKRLGSKTTGFDVQNYANIAADATCGLGDVVRNQIQRSQVEVAMTTAQARGMSLTDGAVPGRALQQTAETLPTTPVQRVPIKARPTLVDFMTVMGLTKATRAYTAEEADFAEKIAATMPVAVQTHLRDGLAPNDRDAFVERVVGLVRLAKALQD